MEMVLRLRMPCVSTVHCERVARASLLIVFSVLLYCCIRSYGADFRIMSEDTGVYGGTMMKSCGLVYGEAEPIVGNAGNTPMEMCGQDKQKQLHPSPEYTFCQFFHGPRTSWHGARRFFGQVRGQEALWSTYFCK